MMVTDLGPGFPPISVVEAAVQHQRFRVDLAVLGGDVDAWISWVRLRLLTRATTLEHEMELAIEAVGKGEFRPPASWVLQCWTRMRPMGFPQTSLGVFALWAVAAELDNDGLTPNGEHVCVDCWGDGLKMERGEPMAVMVPGAVHEERVVFSRAAQVPCACEFTIPDRVSLADVVHAISAMRSPLVTDWPETWLIEMDRAEDAGDVSPRAQWWREFRAWVTVGAEPDADLLAGILLDMTRKERDLDDRPDALSTKLLQHAIHPRNATQAVLPAGYTAGADPLDTASCPKRDED